MYCIARDLKKKIKTFKIRCVSRQRVWGVPIPVFYDAVDQKEVVSKEIIERCCQLIDQEGTAAISFKTYSERFSSFYNCNCRLLFSVLSNHNEYSFKITVHVKCSVDASFQVQTFGGNYLYLKSWTD